MLRQLSLIIALACALPSAFAAQAGRVIFVAGTAEVQGKQAADGVVVQEGDMLSTGATGFMYVKTVDNGLFILRPNTKAKIAAYHIDAKDPANTRIKLELLSGVARSRSGDAVKLARQNFRFNTPVAAIGVRGTDFTVFTDQDTSRVAVISGGIVVSGFGGACRPEGGGPCEGGASRELSATQRGVLLQIQRGQAAPQLMQGNASGPDQVAPPRSDEPVGKNAGVNNASTLVSTEPSLDPKKNDSLNQNKPVVPVVPVVVPPPPIVMPAPDPVVENKPPLPDSTLIWGRWQPLLNYAQKFNLDVQKVTANLLAIDGNYALFQTKGAEYVSPNQGKIGFVMNTGEAHIYTDNERGIRSVENATLSNGKLNVDFGAGTFNTSVDMVSPVDQLTTLTAQGAVTANGGMFGDLATGKTNAINVRGQLSTENGGAAAYIFNGRLGPQRTINGVTYWTK